MKNTIINSCDIQKELQIIEHLGSELVIHLALLSQKIKYLILEIQSCATIEEAGDYFLLLDEIQLILARLVFSNKIEVTSFLRQFISDFDNLEFNKKYIFFKIKNGEYNLI